MVSDLCYDSCLLSYFLSYDISSQINAYNDTFVYSTVNAQNVISKGRFLKKKQHLPVHDVFSYLVENVEDNHMLH